MNKPENISLKIVTLPQLLQKIAQWRIHNRTIAFTNGVFDLLHPGHLKSLNDAAREADFLIVALNSDESVKKLKGPGRPVQDEQARSQIIASLLVVDAVTLFNEDTPLELIRAIRPDVLVKGGDYTQEQIAGAPDVLSYGGRVVINPLLEGYSTSSLVAQMGK